MDILDEQEFYGLMWQPIETAPKTGKRILLYVPKSEASWSYARFVFGWWNSRQFSKRPHPYWTNDMECAFGVVWVRAHQPTHWMIIDHPPGTVLAQRAEHADK